jgi:hypothetical protein
MAGRYTGSYLGRSYGWRAVAILAEIGQASLIECIPGICTPAPACWQLVGPTHRAVITKAARHCKRLAVGSRPPPGTQSLKMLETPLRKSNRPFHRGFIEGRMRKFERNWVGAVVICSVVAGCGDLPDLTVTADHKELCIHGKPGVELLDAKISNAGPGTVVLVGDSNKPWVARVHPFPFPSG